MKKQPLVKDDASHSTLKSAASSAHENAAGKA